MTYTMCEDDLVEARGWQLTSHACRHCLGRLLTRQHGGNIDTQCAECEQNVAGPVDALCCCGVECGTAGRVLECFKNNQIDKRIPQAVLVRERR
jgi:hypothetical protein